MNQVVIGLAVVLFANVILNEKKGDVQNVSKLSVNRRAKLTITDKRTFCLTAVDVLQRFEL